MKVAKQWMINKLEKKLMIFVILRQICGSKVTIETTAGRGNSKKNPECKYWMFLAAFSKVLQGKYKLGVELNGAKAEKEINIA